MKWSLRKVLGEINENWCIVNAYIFIGRKPMINENNENNNENNKNDLFGEVNENSKNNGNYE